MIYDRPLSAPGRDATSLTGRVLVFDSGIGGLTVAQELRALAPHLAVDYAADTGFFPYGDKSDEVLRDRLPRVAKALVARARPDVFVIACNTASTLALAEVRAVLDIPVVGTVPAIKPAAKLSRSKVIGLLATPGTIRRAYTDRLIADFASDAHVIKHGSVELVRLAEAHARGETVPLAAFGAVQAPMFEAAGAGAMDVVVLACTHFPLVRAQLMAAAPWPVTYIDSGEAIAWQTLRVLPGRGTEAGEGSAVYLTDSLDRHSDLLGVFSRFGFGRPDSVDVTGGARTFRSHAKPL